MLVPSEGEFLDKKVSVERGEAEEENQLHLRLSTGF